MSIVVTYILQILQQATFETSGTTFYSTHGKGVFIFSGWKKKDRRGILGISTFEWIYLLCCLMWTLFVSAKQTELLFHAGKAQDNVPRDTKARAFPTRRLTCHTGIFDTIPKILCYLFLEISGGEGKTPHSTDVVHK